MSLDHVVRLDCNPKRALGAGDPRRGEERLSACIVARNRAALIETIAAQQGKAPQDVDVAFARQGEPDAAPLDYDALRRTAAELTPHESACAGCPANVTEQAFGCMGCVNYPIPHAAEVWLMDQLERPGTLGGSLCLSGVKDLGYDGAPIRALRREGFLEARASVPVVFEKKLLRNVTVTSDQVLHAFFGVGSTIRPEHALTLLLWFGGVIIDGRVPRERTDATLAARLVAMATPEERRAATEPNIADPDDPVAEQLSQFLRALYSSWVLDVPIGIDP